MDDRDLLIKLIESDRERFDRVLSALLNLEAQRLDSQQQGIKLAREFAEKWMDRLVRQDRPLSDQIASALAMGDLTPAALRAMADADEKMNPPREN